MGQAHEKRQSRQSQSKSQGGTKKWALFGENPPGRHYYLANSILRVSVSSPACSR
jgi:hypothetical protein